MNIKTKECIINIGSGIDYKILEYVKMIGKIIIPNEKIKIIFDKKKPNGTPKKVLDISLARKYGWNPKIKIMDAISKTYRSYIKEI